MHKLHTENEQRNKAKREKNDLPEGRDFNFNIVLSFCFVKWCSVQMANDAFKLISTPFKFNIATIKAVARNFATLPGEPTRKLEWIDCTSVDGHVNKRKCGYSKPKRINVHWILSGSSIFIGKAQLWFFLALSTSVLVNT